MIPASCGTCKRYDAQKRENVPRSDPGMALVLLSLIEPLETSQNTEQQPRLRCRQANQNISRRTCLKNTREPLQTGTPRPALCSVSISLEITASCGPQPHAGCSPSSPPWNKRVPSEHHSSSLWQTLALGAWNSLRSCHPQNPQNRTCFRIKAVQAVSALLVFVSMENCYFNVSHGSN